MRLDFLDNFFDQKMPQDLSWGICFFGIASNSENLGDALVTVLLCHCRDCILSDETEVVWEI